MKKAFLILLISLSVYSQESTTLSLKETNTFKQKGRSYNILDIHRLNPEKLMASRYGNTYINFETFDNDFNLLSVNTVKRSSNEKISGHFIYKKMLHVFTVDMAKKNHKVYCYTYDSDTNTYSKKLLFEDSVEKNKTIFELWHDWKANVAISPNGKYFCMATKNESKNKNSYLIRVFDTETKSFLFERTYFESATKHYNNYALSIDNNAIIYTLATNSQEVTSNGLKEYELIYSLFKINENSTDILKLNFGKHKLSEVEMVKLDTNIKIIGFYSDSKSYLKDGICSIVIDLDRFKIIKDEFSPFPTQLLKDVLGDKYDKYKSYINLSIDNVIQDPNGSLYITAEELIKTESYNNGSYTTSKKYYDIVILKFNKAGDLEWGRAIDKFTYNKNYAAFIKNDHLHILVNTGKGKEKKKSDNMKFYKVFYKGEALYDIDYNVDGKVNYHIVQNKKGNTEFYPAYGTAFEGKYIMPSISNKSKSFLILE